MSPAARSYREMTHLELAKVYAGAKTSQYTMLVINTSASAARLARIRAEILAVEEEAKDRDYTAQELVHWDAQAREWVANESIPNTKAGEPMRPYVPTAGDAHWMVGATKVTFDALARELSRPRPDLERLRSLVAGVQEHYVTKGFYKASELDSPERGDRP